MLRRVVCSALLALAPFGVAAAQGLSLNTGTSASGGFDQQWEVACRMLTAGSSATSCDAAGTTTSTFNEAALVNVQPDGWATVGTTGGGSYISRLANASLRANAGNENANFEYTFRTTFELGSESPSAYLLNLTRVRFDNYWGGFRLNGGALQVGGLTSAMGGPTGVGTDNWSRDFSLQIGQGFQAGVNTLELVFQGNGLNDGLYVEGAIQSISGGGALVTPEPSTYVLTASGLLAMAAAARRRRTS